MPYRLMPTAALNIAPTASAFKAVYLDHIDQGLSVARYNSVS